MSITINEFNELVKNKKSAPKEFKSEIDTILSTFCSDLKYEVLEPALRYALDSTSIDDYKTLDDYIMAVAQSCYYDDLVSKGFIQESNDDALMHISDAYDSFDIFYEICALNRVKIDANMHRVAESLYRCVYEEDHLASVINKYNSKLLYSAWKALFCLADEYDAFNTVASANNYYLVNPFNNFYAMYDAYSYEDSPVLTFGLLLLDICGLRVDYNTGSCKEQCTFNALLGLNNDFNEIFIKPKQCDAFRYPEELTKKYYNSKILKKCLNNL